MICVGKVRDRAAAEVAREALSAIQIPVEIKLMGTNPYFGSASAEEFEIRVPEDQEEAALAELDRLAVELEQAVYAEAGVPHDQAALEEDDELHADRERPKKVSWALVISLLLPFPGAGCMYARANGVGLTILGLWLGLIVASIAGVKWDYGMELWFGAKLIDLALAPFCVWRFNRNLGHGAATDAARS
jgi:hypothetical protein